MKGRREYSIWVYMVTLSITIFFLKHLGLLVFQLEYIIIYICLLIGMYQKGSFWWWLWLSLLLSKF